MEYTGKLLLEGNGLKSWQIFSEQKGVTIKLRFGESQHGGTPGSEGTVKYAKKAPSQVRRDTKRAEDFRRVTRSKSMKDKPLDSTEIPRSNFDSSNNAADILDSPASVYMGSAIFDTPDPLCLCHP